MDSALVLLAYFAMLLSPCVVAQWGDLLSFTWIVALARRRRTHRAESFLVSFRHERYAMAVALEASFVSANSDFFAAPQPFLVHTRPEHIETPAFIEGRQRVAARLAQLAVAQKLLHDAEGPKKVVAIPPDVEVVAETASIGVHIRPVKFKSSAAEPVAPAQAAAVVAAPATSLVFRDLAELAASLPGGSRNAQVPDPVASRGPDRKPGESHALEKAA